MRRVWPVLWMTTRYNADTHSDPMLRETAKSGAYPLRLVAAEPIKNYHARPDLGIGARISAPAPQSSVQRQWQARFSHTKARERPSLHHCSGEHRDAMNEHASCSNRKGALFRLRQRESTPHGTRYFTEHDCPRIDTLLRLVREARINLTVIRHLLVQIPCWSIRQCGFERRESCPIISDTTQPCWVNRSKCPVVCSQDCYSCDVYRSAPQLETLASLLLAEPLRADAAGR